MRDYEEIAKLAQLKKDGAITPEEFDEQKQAILSSKLKDNCAKRKSGVMFVLLAWFVGVLGIHNFYAGYEKKAVTQLILTLFSWVLFFFPLVIVIVWAFVEMLTVNKDANGCEFEGNPTIILILRTVAVIFVAMTYFAAMGMFSYMFYFMPVA